MPPHQLPQPHNDLLAQIQQGLHSDRHAPTYPYLEAEARREQHKPTPDDIQ